MARIRGRARRFAFCFLIGIFDAACALPSVCLPAARQKDQTSR
jgi:hypothetical protein